MNNEFKIGDVVYLNSDLSKKAPMTIDSFKNNEVICKWITSIKNQTIGWFDPRMLHKLDKTK